MKLFKTWKISGITSNRTQCHIQDFQLKVIISAKNFKSNINPVKYFGFELS
jgi:hypothetical protein